jgi:TRAP-type C4-dicarboxylate transport system substrate-binding protein
MKKQLTVFGHFLIVAAGNGAQRMIKSRRLFSLIVLVLALALVLPMAHSGSPNIVQMDKPLKLKMGSPFPPPPVTHGIGIEYFEKRLTERTGGKITFQNFWGGSLVTAGEMLDAFQKRVVDMGMGSWFWSPGKLPLGTFEFAFPFRPTDPQLCVTVKRQMWDSFPSLQKELTNYNIRHLFFFPTLSYELMSNKPIKTLEDMKGKKIAVMSAETARWVEAVGAVPIHMPGPEKYVALQRGTIDGQIIAMDVAADLKHHEVCKYYTSADIGASAPGAGWMNLGVYNSFSQELRELIDELAIETEKYNIELLMERTAGYIDIFKKAGVTFYTISEADRVKWAKLMPDTPAQWAKKLEELGWPAGWEIVEGYNELTSKAGHKWIRRWGQR